MRALLPPRDNSDPATAPFLQLQTLLPEGLLVDGPWLAQKGYDHRRVAAYCREGWLWQVAPGVYRRPGLPLV